MFINFAFVIEYIKMAVLYSAICARLTICHIVSLAPSWTNCEVEFYSPRLTSLAQNYIYLMSISIKVYHAPSIRNSLSSSCHVS